MVSTSSLWRYIRSVVTYDVPVLFVNAAGVDGRVHCVPGEIRWYVAFLTMSPRWTLDPLPNVIRTYWVMGLA